MAFDHELMGRVRDLAVCDVLGTLAIGGGLTLAGDSRLGCGDPHKDAAALRGIPGNSASPVPGVVNMVNVGDPCQTRFTIRSSTDGTTVYHSLW